METRTLICILEKYGLYAALLFGFYILQEMPAASFFGIRSAPVIGLFIAVSMVENEFTGALYGLAAGLLCDTAAAHFFGLASMLFLVEGCIAGLLVMYYFNSCPRTAFFFTGAAAGIYNLISYYVLYGVWGYAGAARLLLPEFFLSTAFTAVWGLLFFFLVRRLHHWTAQRIGEA